MECPDDFFLFITVMYVVDIHVRFYGLGWQSFHANGWNMFDIIVASGSLITTISVRVGASGYVIDQLQKLFLVSIAFKLVQRMNSLNKLFKTAVYVARRDPTFSLRSRSLTLFCIFRSSLPVIVSLLSLWLVLFMFFGILFVEVFSMTKWNTAETRYENYSTMGRTLVMLAFMTTGCASLSFFDRLAFTRLLARAGINTCTICEQVPFVAAGQSFHSDEAFIAPSIIPGVLYRLLTVTIETAGASAGPIRFSLRGIF